MCSTALRSIEKGKYGICERCGKDIDPERLEVRPDATLCINCQAEVEKLIRRGITPRTKKSASRASYPQADSQPVMARPHPMDGVEP